MEFNRFLEYYKNAPEIEEPQAGGDKKKERKDRKSRGESHERSRKAEKGYARLFLNLGKTDGFFPNQVIDLINHYIKKERIQVGRIDLMQNFSFFEVIESQAPLVVKALNRATVNGRKVVVEFAEENDGKSDKSGKKREKKERTRSERKTKAERASSGGSKGQDDWMQFFRHDGSADSSMDEAWGKRSKKRKK